MSYFLEVGDNCIMVRKLDMDQINSCLKIHYDFKIVQLIFIIFRRKYNQIQDYRKLNNNSKDNNFTPF